MVLLEPNDATVMLVGAVWPLLPTLRRCTADRERRRGASTSTTRSWYWARCCSSPNDAAIVVAGAISFVQRSVVHMIAGTKNVAAFLVRRAHVCAPRLENGMDDASLCD